MGLSVKLYIKNMVCDRCKMVVESCLSDLGLVPVSVTLGMIDFGEQTLSEQQLTLINDQVALLGFEVIKDKKSRLIDQIKTSIIELLNCSDEDIDVTLSVYLSSKIHHDYKYMSHLFSSVEGVTIEQYFINHKIEKAKELLVYGELNLTEIAARLGYSSLAHLSGQFKKVTGLTPSHFRKLRDTKSRRPLDKV
jgi:AraC-like DNA-binding protein